MIHAGSIESDRLKPIYDSLKAAGDKGMTTLEIAKIGNSVCASTCISEIRAGLPENEQITCDYVGRSDEGRKVFKYTWWKWF